MAVEAEGGHRLCDLLGQTTKFESVILVKTYRYLYCRNSGTIHLNLPDFWTPAYSKTKYSREYPLADLTISIDAKEHRTKLSASTRKEGKTPLVIRNGYHLSWYDTDWFGAIMFMVKPWIVVADSARAWTMAWRWKHDMDGDTLGGEGEFYQLARLLNMIHIHESEGGE